MLLTQAKGGHAMRLKLLAEYLIFWVVVIGLTGIGVYVWDEIERRIYAKNH